MNKLITKKEAATILHRSIDTVERLLKKKILTAIREHGKVLLDREQVISHGVETINDPVHISLRSAARKMGCSVAYVQELISRKRIRTLKVYGVRHPLKSSVEAFIKAKADRSSERAEDKKFAKDVAEHFNDKDKRRHRVRGQGGKFTKAPRTAPAPAPKSPLNAALVERGLDPKPASLDEAIGLRNAIQSTAPAVHDPVAIYRAATGAAKVQAYRSLPPQLRNRVIEAQRVPEPEFDLEAYRRRCEADPY